MKATDDGPPAAGAAVEARSAGRRHVAGSSGFPGGDTVTRRFGTMLVTGGAGFMGSDFIRHVFRRVEYAGRVITLDALTYAGDQENLAGLEPETRAGRHVFIHGSIVDRALVRRIFHDHEIDGVVHFAAESHVDRSIVSAEAFGMTNVVGTVTLLEAARRAWGGRRDVLFHQVSTDEVFGSCREGEAFAEGGAYDPSSPYAASKAAADHMVRAFGHTHGMPYTITHACNNYGPRQTPDKLIPLVITRLMDEKPIPVYGRGDNVREWLFVEDHSQAVWDVVTRGRAGGSYNVGSAECLSNLELIERLGCDAARAMGRAARSFEKRIVFVADRPGHDQRYALARGALWGELGWRPRHALDQGLAATLAWYRDHRQWTDRANARLDSRITAEGGE